MAAAWHGSIFRRQLACNNPYSARYPPPDWVRSEETLSRMWVFPSAVEEDSIGHPHVPMAVCLNRGVHPTKVCHKCAVPFDPICANLRLLSKRFRAGLAIGKSLILQRESGRSTVPDSPTLNQYLNLLKHFRYEQSHRVRISSALGFPSKTSAEITPDRPESSEAASGLRREDNSISVFEGVLGGLRSHPHPLLSISYGP
jgi:hypothetical protein